MSKRAWYLALGILAIGFSALLYYAHYLIFRDPHHIFIYMLGDLAFVGLEVLLVSLIVDQIIRVRDRRAALEKMNMVIGSFFSQVGNDLLRMLCCKDEDRERKARVFAEASGWTDRDFERVAGEVPSMDFYVDSKNYDLERMREFLKENRDFMIRLLENPMLLEHESFTDQLWAVFHLTEELAHRPDFDTLPESDLEHLAVDMERTYGRLTREWVSHMKHLKDSYPYLFSLATRLNPFQVDASPIVVES